MYYMLRSDPRAFAFLQIPDFQGGAIHGATLFFGAAPNFPTTSGKADIWPEIDLLWPSS